MIISEVFYSLIHSVILRKLARNEEGSSPATLLRRQRCTHGSDLPGAAVVTAPALRTRERHCLLRVAVSTAGTTELLLPLPEYRARRLLLPAAEPPRPPPGGRAGRRLRSAPARHRRPPPAPVPQHPGRAVAVKRSWPRGCFAEGSPCSGPRRDPIGAVSARDTAHRQLWTGTGWR